MSMNDDSRGTMFYCKITIKTFNDATPLFNAFTKLVALRPTGSYCKIKGKYGISIESINSMKSLPLLQCNSLVAKCGIFPPCFWFAIWHLRNCNAMKDTTVAKGRSRWQKLGWWWRRLQESGQLIETTWPWLCSFPCLMIKIAMLGTILQCQMDWLKYQYQ